MLASTRQCQCASEGLFKKMRMEDYLNTIYHLWATFFVLEQPRVRIDNHSQAYSLSFYTDFVNLKMV